MTDAEKIYDFCDEMWERQIIPQLTEYIKIPAKSPAFDAAWEDHGYMRAAMDLIETWVRASRLLSMRQAAS